MGQLRSPLICFNNIILNINVIKNGLVYFLPVNPAKERSEKKGKDNASVSNNSADIIDGITNGYQH